jgi:hypothetical protein
MSTAGGDTDTYLSVAIFQIFRSIAKLALRYGLSAGALGELLRRASVEAASDILREDKEKASTSRICAMTGLYRKEVRRIEELPPITISHPGDKFNRSARVVSGWRTDPDFLTSTGKPATLNADGEKSFETLVRRYSGDMTPSAMKMELERLGLLTVSGRKRMKLHSNSTKTADAADAMQILGSDASDLINTISHNIDPRSDDRLFQRKVSYAAIPEQHVAEFFELAAKESQKLLEKFDIWLAKRDYDSTSENCRRIGVGIYQFQDKPLISADRPADPKTGSHATRKALS